MLEEVANSGERVPETGPFLFGNSEQMFESGRESWYNPSLPLADTKWSLFWLHLFSIYAVYSVFMRLLEF